MENTNKTSRTLVNVIGIPSLLFIICYGESLFLLLIGAVMLIGASELLSLSRVKEANPFSIILYVGLSVICILHYLHITDNILEWIMLILIIFGIFYTLMAIAIYSLKNNIDNQSDLGNIISSFINK